MRTLFVLLASLAAPALAADPVLRPSAELLFKRPELLQPGHCVAYREGGSGWVMTDPVYYLKGTVRAAEVRTRHLGHCPTVPGKNIEQYSRDEFNRHALAYPCVAAAEPEREEQLGVVSLLVTDWETPHAVRAASAGRLYRGMFIDRKLEKGMEIELEADLLETCDQ
jgi:hypothetical protein